MRSATHGRLRPGREMVAGFAWRGRMRAWQQRVCGACATDAPGQHPVGAAAPRRCPAAWECTGSMATGAPVQPRCLHPPLTRCALNTLSSDRQFESHPRAGAAVGRGRSPMTRVLGRVACWGAPWLFRRVPDVNARQSWSVRSRATRRVRARARLPARATSTSGAVNVPRVRGSGACGGAAGSPRRRSQHQCCSPSCQLHRATLRPSRPAASLWLPHTVPPMPRSTRLVSLEHHTYLVERRCAW